MGNYENLKQSITEVIRTNGNQEITGAVLQSTLLTIISTVGANATFAGIATPATNPGTPDGPVFWLASENGTYSNFGSIELQDGLSALMWNGSWSSQQILSIDNELKNDSKNLIENGVVASNILRLNDVVNPVHTDNLFDAIKIVHNKTINGTILVDSTSWNVSGFIPVQENNLILFYVTNATFLQKNYRVFFDFYTEDMSWISHTEGTKGNFLFDCCYITAPINAAFVRLQYSNIILDTDKIMVTIGDMSNEYIPFNISDGYTENSLQKEINVFSESDLSNTQRSINLLDERKLLKSIRYNNSNVFSKGWMFINDSTKCALNDKLSLNPNSLYRLCAFNPAAYDITIVVYVYAMDENDALLASGTYQFGTQTDETNGIIYSRFKISDGMTVPANTDHYRIAFTSNIQDYKLQLVLESNYSIYHHSFKELSYANLIEKEIKRAKQAEEVLDTKIVNTTDVGSILTPNPMRLVCGISAPVDDITALINGIDIDHFTSKDYCKADNTVVFSHDSTMVIVDGKIYGTYVGNNTNYEDNPSSIYAYVKLAIVDTAGFGTGSSVTKIDIAKNGDTVDGKTIISGAGVPNIVSMGDSIVRIIFSAKLSDNIYYLLYRDYDISNSTLGTVGICTFIKDNVEYEFTTPNISQQISEVSNLDCFISMNAQIGIKDGIYYAGVCVGNYVKSSILFTSQNMKDFQFWLTPNIEGNDAVFEGACICKGNYLWYALRQEAKDIINPADRKMIIAHININTKEIEHYCRITDAASRACWIIDNNKLYLLHSILNRKRLEIVIIDEQNIYNSKIVSISGDWAVYPSCVKYNDYFYFSATGASSTNIYFRRCPALNRYTVKQAESKIASALRLNDVW